MSDKSKDLAAAAKVGEQDINGIETKLRWARAMSEVATIERCAKVAEDYGTSAGLLIAGEIRALKANRTIDPNLIYPGKDPDFVFPEE